MPLVALLLLLTSAVLHVSWNLLLKNSGERFLATWWAVLLGGALFLPALFYTGLPARGVWGLVLISAAIEVLYYGVLSAAYDNADLSLVYPIGRGAAPGLIALWSILFLGERPSPAGYAGLVIVVLGLLLIGLPGILSNRPASARRADLRGVGLALLLAAIISIYSTIDGAAVKRSPALSYAAVLFLLTPALMTPFVIHRYGRSAMRSEWANHRLRLVFMGILNVGAYFMALAAFAIAPVSYSGAVREVSVVLGAVLGWRLLGEEMGPWRGVGAATVVAGIFVISIYG